MLTNPRVGTRVQAWYRGREAFPLHGRVGAVVVPSRGRPRNHGVHFGDVVHIVPCGNLRRVGARDGP